MAGNGFASMTKNVPNHVNRAFTPLLLAARYARQVGSDPWEFAVEIDQLTGLDLTPNDFRWLVRSGLVEHRREITLEGNDGRQFRETGDLTFCERTCFLLTDRGIELATQLAQRSPAAMSERTSRDRLLGWTPSGAPLPHGKGAGTTAATVPRWDADRRELRFNGAVVKHFKWVAANQQAILCAFEEDGWPPRIDDPLPPQQEQDSKRRLADTIKCLNRKQCYAVIHFRGDGTGEGVIWDVVDLS